MGRITIYLPDDLEEDLEGIDNTSKFIQRAVKKELGYDPEIEEPEKTLTNRLDTIEKRLELLRQEAATKNIGTLKLGTRSWEELEETHK